MLSNGNIVNYCVYQKKEADWLGLGHVTQPEGGYL